MANFNMSDYVTVAERLTQAHDQISIVVTEPPVLLTEAMGYIRATVALKDGRSATATASFRLDLQNRSAQATNPLEDSETSAIGRALGFLGYGSSKSVASREEVQETERRRDAPASFKAPATNGSTPPPVCDVCGATGRLGKDKRSYFCPDKSAHNDKWYTIPTHDTEEWDAIDAAAARKRGAVVEESLPL